MDVDQTHFWAQLLRILKSISCASFIAIDLEMGGISIRQYGLNDRSHNLGKLSLQQQYAETKKAAETYQVLQLGITCVEEDQERGTQALEAVETLDMTPTCKGILLIEAGVFVARPFNFNVTPLFINGDKLDVNRDFTMSSSAIHFLMKNSFDMGTIFTKGVPYLSRKEEAFARQKFGKRQEASSSIPDIVISPDDSDALNFYNKARSTIIDWLSLPKGAMDFVNIAHPGGLNGFQRRLVHQLIRNEFPKYRTYSRSNGDFMQVEKIDNESEARIAKARLQAFEASLVKQTGLRFIFEAMTRGDLAGLDPKLFCVSENGEPAFCDVESIKKELQGLKEALKAKSSVLVGHNLFTDLTFIYKTFIGNLPNEVVEFSRRVHDLFPRVIDTKYLATHDGGSMHTKSGLKDLYDELKGSGAPSIILAEKHANYRNKAKEHEAGYDSWMTAQVFVKLCSKLVVERVDGSSVKMEAMSELGTCNLVDPMDTGGAIINLPDTDAISWSKKLSRRNLGDANGNTNGLYTSKTSSSKPEFNTDNYTDTHQQTDGAEDGDSSLPSPLDRSNGGVLLTDRVAATEPSLLDGDIDDGFQVVSYKQSHLRTKSASKSTSSNDAKYDDAGMLGGISRYWAAQMNKYAALDPHQPMQGSGQENISTISDLTTTEKNMAKQLMPRIDSTFWKIYANRLRVYGTETGICYLGD